MVNIAEKIRQESSTVIIQGFLPWVTTFSVSVCYHGGVNLLAELLQTQFSNNSLLLLFSVCLFVFYSLGVVGRGVFSVLKFLLHLPFLCKLSLKCKHLCSSFPVAQAEVQASWVFCPVVVSLSLMFDPTLIGCSCYALQIAVLSTE